MESNLLRFITSCILAIHLFGCSSNNGGESQNQPTAAIVQIEASSTSGTAETLFHFAAKESFFDIETNLLATPEETSFEWSVSDGRAFSGDSISINFDEGGIHTVELTVTSPDGISNTDDYAVTIFSENSLGPESLSLPERYSDVNNDGVVNALDFLIVAQDIGGVEKIEDEEVFLRSDISIDGKIASQDLNLLGKAILNNADLPSTVIFSGELRPFSKATLVSPKLLDPQADITLTVDDVNVEFFSRNILGYIEFIVPQEIIGGRSVDLSIISNGSEVDNISVFITEVPVLTSTPIALLETYGDLLNSLAPTAADKYKEIYGNGELAGLYQEIQAETLKSLSDVIDTLVLEENQNQTNTIASFLVSNGLIEKLEAANSLKQSSPISSRNSFASRTSSYVDVCGVTDWLCITRRFNDIFGDSIDIVNDVCIVASLISTRLGPDVALKINAVCLVSNHISIVNTALNNLTTDIDLSLLFTVNEVETGQRFNLLPEIELKDATGICRAPSGEAMRLGEKYLADKVADIIEAFIKKKKKLNKLKKLLESLDQQDGSLQVFEDFVESITGKILSKAKSSKILSTAVEKLRSTCEKFGLKDRRFIGKTDPLKIIDLPSELLTPNGDGSADFVCGQDTGEITAVAIKYFCKYDAQAIYKRFTCGSQGVTVTFGDNGNLLDDIFAVNIGGESFSSNSPVRATTGTVTLASGSEHDALISGLAAPDGVGTYYISFSGATVVSGQTSGEDLVPGVTKKITIRVD